MKLSLWASRLVALIILIAGIGLLQLMVGEPLIDSFREHRESISRSQQMLTKYQELNSYRAQMHSRLKQAQTAHKSEARLLTGSSAQLAGAKLQNDLKDLIEANNAILGSMQLLPVREEERFRRISMSVSFKATINSLQSILYEIETHTPYLFVENLQVGSSQVMLGSSTPGGPDELQVRLEIFSYMSSDAS